MYIYQLFVSLTVPLPIECDQLFVSLTVPLPFELEFDSSFTS